MLDSDLTLYASWNQTVPIKDYLLSLISGYTFDPLSYIPSSMRQGFEGNLLSSAPSDDYSSFVDVEDIPYGGYGEQWQMVLTNVSQSELFYNVLLFLEDTITSSVVLFNNYLDQNPGDSADHTVGEEGVYTATLKYSSGVLEYTLAYESGFEVPYFGSVAPSLEMTYEVDSGEREVFINLTQNNQLRYVIGENSYEFGIRYGVSGFSRIAYCLIQKEGVEVSGHIYEYIGTESTELINSCADFYIGSTYAKCVGNKASGMLAFKGYVNELYLLSTGKLLGYEVEESLTIAGITADYHTLWFNLSDISGISSVKVVDWQEEDSKTLNPNKVYVNGSSSVFTPDYNSIMTVKTSRKYDIELREQTFYGLDAEGEILTYTIQVPMMFIQEGENYDDFSNDMEETSEISGASVTLSSVYVDQITSDHASLVEAFKANKENVTREFIDSFIAGV